MTAIILGTSDSIVAVMSAAAATTNPIYNTGWVDTTGDSTSGAKGSLNGVTEVAIVAAPSSGQRQVDTIRIYNGDTAPVTVTVSVANGANRYALGKWIIPINGYADVLSPSDIFSIGGVADDSSKFNGQLPSYYFGATSASEAVFGTGDGSSYMFQIPRLASASAIYSTNWQGRQLLYATARTNYIPRSGDLTAWDLPNMLTPVATGTIGGHTIWDCVPNTTAGVQHFLAKDLLGTSDGQTVYVGMVLARLGYSKTRVSLKLRNGSVPQFTVDFDAKTTTSGTLTDLGSGLYLFQLFGIDLSSGSTTPRLYIYPNTSITFTGDGVSGVRIGPVWCQSATGAYIPTTTAPVTLTDYVLSPTGLVTLAQVPVSGASLTYTGTDYSSILGDSCWLDSTTKTFEAPSVCASIAGRIYQYSNDPSIVINESSQKLIWGTHTVEGTETAYGDVIVFQV